MSPLWETAVRALAGAHVQALRERWMLRERSGSVHDVIDEIVAADPPPAWPNAVAEAAAAARAAIVADARWRHLITSLGLTGRETEWLALLAACELTPRLHQVLGYLEDAATPAPPTPAIAALLWNWPPGYQPGPAGSLARWALAAPAEDCWHSTTPWTVEADIAGYLAGEQDWLAARADATLLDTTGLQCLQPALLAEMGEAASGVRGAGCEVELVGAPGSGRRTLLAQLAVALGRTPALLDAGAGVRGLRAARLLDALPIWDCGVDSVIGVDASPGALTFVARSAPARSTPAGVVRLSWTMPATTAGQRQRLWADRSDRQPPRIIEDWELTPADIDAAAAAGAGASKVVRNRLRAGALETMSPLALPYGWDDLVVPEQVEAALRRLRNQVLLRQEVLDDWEFRRLCPSTAGVTALFAGPSGTGKTMAAQVLARELELDLYRVDLATVVSKYIGETEKQLAAVFSEAERSNVLIFFDEADALFGQRTQVRDAHDRYANIEIDYLLQRLDTFSGVAILATNRKSDLDAAFLRRLRTVIDFVAPARAERLRLWQLALPERTSTGEPITGVLDHEWLATHLELTGAEIKSIALSAAFDAREEGALISAETVLNASRRELSKRGAVLRLEHPVQPGHPAAVAL
ncbi:MAG TPA: ATP-binding protein [Jatrophihabitans sp.]|uniref:ATP-binding protein n=1 Tax=Jatrophihabitans sp. TaxID=1932789 RepID=UPI002F07AF2F